MKLWPATWWPREAWWRDPDDMVQVVGWGPFPLPGERKASRERGAENRARWAEYAAEAERGYDPETIRALPPREER